MVPVNIKVSLHNLGKTELDILPVCSGNLLSLIFSVKRFPKSNSYMLNVMSHEENVDGVAAGLGETEESIEKYFDL